MREEECRSFASKAGLPLDKIVPHDLLTGVPSRATVQKVDALMVGGSGDYYVSNRSLPHFEAHLDFLAEIVEKGMPMFASCFGFQIMVEALGGRIVFDPDNVEVGTYDVFLTAAGREDPLFRGLPNRFPAQLGRKDRAEILPGGVIHLAASERSRFQSLRIPGKPIWATQFHPELDRRTNLQRFDRYLEGYASHMSENEQHAARARFRESPEAAELLPAFVDLVFG